MRFIGRVFLGPNNQMISDNDTQTGMMLDRVLAMACRLWFRRFRAAVAHPGLITRAMMQPRVCTAPRRPATTALHPGSNLSQSVSEGAGDPNGLCGDGRDPG